MMSEQKPCIVLDAPEAKSFNLRLQYSATNPPDNQCVETEVPVAGTAAGELRCTVQYWSNQRLERQNWVKISVVITRTRGGRHRHKLVAAHIDLPCRDGAFGGGGGAPPQSVVRERVPAGGDCLGGVSLRATRKEVEEKCVVALAYGGGGHHFAALCTVAVSNAWPPAQAPAPPPSGLDHDILVARDLADVSFRVEGETFDAHRLVLAARSPVFKAELFGAMAESRASCIAIQDMRAPTFRSLLHFMYHGCLPPPAAGPDDETGDDGGMVEFQHLCVAADRYGLDTLKQMCEEILCTGVSVSTVLSSLVFAEERMCHRLKSWCLDFLSVVDNFMEVAATDEYVDLMKDAPSLLAQVRNRLRLKKARVCYDLV